MRPINRRDGPTDSNGNPIIFTHYKEAAPYLKERLGKYCSYCELKFPNTHVEHIQPKSEEAALEKTWNNFLLACISCNSIKGKKTINEDNLSDYFWPDMDNTCIPFIYEKNRAPQVSTNLSAIDKKIAENTLALTGLDREPTHPKFNFKKDERWQERIEAWSKAERAKTHLEQQSTELMCNQVIDTATSTGFWSVWMTVFQDYTDMRRRLIEAFQGTSEECFDHNTQPVQRVGGKI